MYSVSFTPQGEKSLRKLARIDQKRVIKKLEFYLSHEDPLRFAERLVDAKIGNYRFRVGDHRIIFDLEGEEIVVLLVGHRREIYR